MNRNSIAPAGAQKPRWHRGRRVAPVVVIGLIATLSLPHGFRAEAEVPGGFCNVPASMRGMGSATQLALWIDHFIESYELECPKAQGLVAYDASGEPAAVDGAIAHYYGDPSDPYMIYVTDLTLSSSEYYQAFLDTRNAFRPALASFINHFPTHLYGVALGYNLGGCSLSRPLRLTPRTLSLIYSGVIASWNDPVLVVGDPANINDDNPDLANCPLRMKVSIRRDAAASTVVVKDYMSQENDLFDVYRVKELNTSWPQTLTPDCYGLGDLGMSTCLSVSGRIGYVLYQEAAERTNYSFAEMWNRGGSFVAPATNVSPTAARVNWPDNCPDAAQTLTVATTTQDWSNVSLTGTPSGYPLCNFGYALAFLKLYEAYHGAIDPLNARTTADVLEVVYRNHVQDGLKAFNLAPLPPSTRSLGRTGVSNLTL